MGRAIDHDNILDDHERRLKLLEDALEEMIQTRVHHVDLHEKLEKHESGMRNVTVEDDDIEFLPPAGKRKKTKRTNKATATT